jgi:hypothetical protein
MSTLLMLLALSAEPACKQDRDCTLTTWACCACPRPRAVSLAALKKEEDVCARKDCERPACEESWPKPGPDDVAVCRGGACVMGKKADAAPGAQCRVADDCDVEWTGGSGACPCPDTPRAVKKPAVVKPRPKKCPEACLPRPEVTAECLEGRCSLAPHALTK